MVHKIIRYFRRCADILNELVLFGSGSYIKGLSVENVTAPTTSNYKLNPQLSYFGT